MQVWFNKTKNQLFLLTEWWEVFDNPIELNHDKSETKAKWGMLVQVGWLMRNHHGVWLGVNTDVTKDETLFEYVGQL